MTNVLVIFQEVKSLIEQLGLPTQKPVQRDIIILGENWLETHPIYQRNDEIPAKYIQEIGILARINELLDKLTITSDHYSDFFTYCHSKQILRNHAEARRLRVLALLFEEGLLVYKSDFVHPEQDMPITQITPNLPNLETSLSSTPKNYYAVAKGRRIGIYTTWPLCKEQVHNFSGAVYKKFTSFDEAAAFIELHTYTPFGQK